MKWLLAFGFLLTGIIAHSQHVETVHPRTNAVVEFHIGDPVFFKKHDSRATQSGTILGFRNDSIILNNDSFLVQELRHIGPRSTLGHLVFSTVTLYELFGAVVQYGIGGAFYTAYTTDIILEDRSLLEAATVAGIFYTVGAFIKAQGRFFKNTVFVSYRKRSIQLVRE